MIKATEARVKSIEVRNKLLKQEKKMVDEKIRQAVEKGELCCLINAKISDSLMEELKINGFHLEILGILNDAPLIKISW